MALLDWLGLGGADTTADPAAEDPNKKKAPAAGIDVMKAFGIAQQAAAAGAAAASKGDNKPSQASLDETAQAKKNIQQGFWASLLGNSAFGK